MDEDDDAPKWWHSFSTVITRGEKKEELTAGCKPRAIYAGQVEAKGQVCVLLPRLVSGHKGADEARWPSCQQCIAR